MTKFVMVYTGGSMGGSPEEQQKIMDAWINWFGSMGDALIDAGNPFSQGCTIAPDGTSSDGGAAGLSGYSIIEASDLSGAADVAGGCPVLTNGGGLQIYEAMPM